MSFTIREKNRETNVVLRTSLVYWDLFKLDDGPDAVTSQIKDSQTLTGRVLMCL